MRSHRKRLLLGLILGLSLGIGCTNGDFPTETSVELSAADNLNVSPVTAVLLLCEPQPYLSTAKVIGSKGGNIRVGKHALSIPAGALSQDVVIVAEQVSGSTNSVRFSPDGLTFTKPAALTMTYDNCMSVPAQKSIVYTTERLGILERLSSLDKGPNKIVTSEIDHFSRYAVAY